MKGGMVMVLGWDKCWLLAAKGCYCLLLLGGGQQERGIAEMFDCFASFV